MPSQKVFNWALIVMETQSSGRGKNQLAKRLASQNSEKDRRQLREENSEDLSTIIIKAIEVLLAIKKKCEPYLNALEELRYSKNSRKCDKCFMDHQETRNCKWPGELFKYIRPLGDTTAV